MRNVETPGPGQAPALQRGHEGRSSTQPPDFIGTSSGLHQPRETFEQDD